jgi:hypothetical protein
MERLTIKVRCKKLGMLALDKFRKRCFYVGIHTAFRQPYQIVAGVVNDMDRMTKQVVREYFSIYRKLPPRLRERRRDISIAS